MASALDACWGRIGQGVLTISLALNVLLKLETHVLEGWQRSSYCSPLVYHGHVYLVNKTGVASCLDLQTGQLRWTERLPGACWASPLGALGRVYFFTKDGSTVVIKAGPNYEPLAENELSATDIVYGVAAVEDSILIRYGRGLVRLGTPAPPAP